MGAISKIAPFIIMDDVIMKGAKNMIVKLFTHTDLDGVGNAILSKHAFKKVDVSYCECNSINKEVMDFIKNDGLNAYDMVFITDISVNTKVAEEIDFYSCYEKVVLLDHHKTSEWMNKYDWCLSVEEVDGKLTCGTQLFYEYLVENGYLKATKNLDEFVEKVRRWDVFDWKKHNDIVAHDLNMLHGIIGRNDFVERFTKNTSVEFTKEEKMLLNLEKAKYSKMLDEKRKNLIEKPFQSNGLDTFNIGVVFCDEYISAIGNDLANENPHLDFIILINASKKSLSFRARQESNVDLSEIAKMFGGGGHKYASGASIKEDKFDKIINILIEV